ncbi:bifunctional hydroxymethylpyrimidine kinase/phosphomethylpyrimidine kinase [Methylocystis sp. FS]|uniref:bifunctional hydroxymethylpyrimidine kinase/phosphomethylpyrimidine kinase n=1 Tax=Methylocystis silviterrae TaxID=2743612 RepID=UPI0015840A56|nr:bifunctional hydroxymethylpyrimidine kinase/phosphomethylpyrimidine kinase [Methylocystis silviterrae]NUJ80882.1 bifunctional hydroxymethylpyrimidine kinase/phosphomethylpyrimidine kinase [Methylocystis silviterrae]
MAHIPKLLSIAGSDPSGGAGVQADLKIFSAFGCYGMAAITALTAQNTQGVTASYPVAPEIVAAQIEAVLSDIAPDAIKIGMLATPDIARAVAETLARHGARNVVLDPVLVPTQGVSLASAGLKAALVSSLPPLARLVTPNLHEASALTQTPLATSAEEMAAQGRLLCAADAHAVLVKGGDLEGEPVDVLFAAGERRIFRGRRIPTRNTHGTGCALSSAIACELAKGASLIDAIAAAKVWLEGALEAADQLRLSEGRGPPHHFYALWR